MLPRPMARGPQPEGSDGVRSKETFELRFPCRNDLESELSESFLHGNPGVRLRRIPAPSIPSTNLKCSPRSGISLLSIERSNIAAVISG